MTTKLKLLTFVGILLLPYSFYAQDCDDLVSKAQTDVSVLVACLDSHPGLTDLDKAEYLYRAGQKCYKPLEDDTLSLDLVDDYANATHFYFQQYITHSKGGNVNQLATATLYSAEMLWLYLKSPLAADSIFSDLQSFLFKEEAKIDVDYLAFIKAHLSFYLEKKGDISNSLLIAKEGLRHIQDEPGYLEWSQLQIQLGVLYNMLHDPRAIYHNRQEITHYNSPEGWHGLGNAYLNLNRLDSALICYNAALKLYGDQYIGPQAQILNNRAVTYLERVKIAHHTRSLLSKEELLSKAEIDLIDALSINENLGRKGSLARNHDNLGDLFVIKGDEQKAKKHYRESIELYKKAYENYQQAIEYSTSLPLDDSTENPVFDNFKVYQLHVLGNELFTFLGSKAMVAYKLHELGENQNYLELASITFENAFHALQMFRNQVTNRASKLFWTETGYKIFETAIATALEQDDKVKALEWSERAKAAILLENLQAKNALQNAIDPALMQREIDLNYQIAYYERLSREQDSAVEYSSRIQALKREKDQFIKQLELEYPSYYQLKYKNKRLNLDKLRQSIGPNTALVEYFMGEEHLYIFALTEDKLFVQRTPPVSDDEVHHFIESIVETESINPEKLDAFKKLGHNLFRKLIQPVLEEANLPGKLLIVPDGQLGLIPFEALVINPGEGGFDEIDYLIESHSISYAYSANVLLSSLEQTKNKSVANKKMLVYAPTNFASPFDEKPFLKNGAQAQNIVAKFGDAQLREGLEASVANFEKDAPGYGYIHLNTHAEANENEVRIFFNKQEGQGRDKLSLEDIYGLSLHAELVVLSACETGKGALQRGEGIASLAHGFTYAGVNGTIMSLWEINRDINYTFMNDFYGHLALGQLKNEALHAVKLSRVNDSSPFYWAAFVLTGNVSPVVVPWYKTLALLLFLAGLPILFILIKSVLRSLKK